MLNPNEEVIVVARQSRVGPSGSVITQYLIPLIFVTLLLISTYTNVVISRSNSDLESGHIEIIKARPFNNTIFSSLTIDPISDLVYVSGTSDYSCSKENPNPSNESSFKLHISHCRMIILCL